MQLYYVIRGAKMNKVELFRLIGAISRTATTEMNQNVSQYGLNNNLFIYLSRIVENEGITQTELVELSKVDKTTLSRAISKLEQKGYVVSIINKKRFKELYPTDKAKKIYNTVFKIEQSYVEKALTNLCPMDLVCLKNLLDKIDSSIS